MPKSSASSSRSVSFRLRGTRLQALQELAEANGWSPGEAARELVVQALEGGGQEGLGELGEQLVSVASALVETRAELEEVRDQQVASSGALEALRGDLATVLEVVLLNVTKLTEADVRAFVSQHLRK